MEKLGGDGRRARGCSGAFLLFCVPSSARALCFGCLVAFAFVFRSVVCRLSAALVLFRFCGFIWPLARLSLFLTSKDDRHRFPFLLQAYLEKIFKRPAGSNSHQYDGAATLKEVDDADAASQELLLDAFACAMLGVPAHRFYFLFSPRGRQGKGELRKLCGAVFGSYLVQAKPQLFQADRRTAEDCSPFLYSAAGSRVMWMDEVGGEDSIWDVQRFCNYVSEDKQHARKLGSNKSKVVDPTWNFFATGNAAPTFVKPPTESVRTRLATIYLPNRFCQPDEMQLGRQSPRRCPADNGIDAQTKAMGVPLALVLCERAAAGANQEGGPAATALDRARNTAKSGGRWHSRFFPDLAADFLSEMVEYGPVERVGPARLYTAARAWLQSRAGAYGHSCYSLQRPLSDATWKEMLEKHLGQPVKVRGVYGFKVVGKLRDAVENAETHGH